MKIYFLWTGGWDSTFRIIQLYNQNLTIQPIYIIDPSRKSNKKEIETINLLSELIPKKFENSKGKILPLELIKRNEIKINLFIKLIFQLIRKLNPKKKLGKQYLWIACLSRDRKLGFELCFHKETKGVLIHTSETKEITDEFGGRNWVLIPEKMKILKRQIFKNMRFPLMYISKLEMRDHAENNNYLDLMNKTWFCHRSEDKPCGKCAPCKLYVEHGFEERLKE